MPFCVQLSFPGFKEIERESRVGALWGSGFFVYGFSREAVV